MTKIIDAIFCGGVLKPVVPLEGIEENDRVTVTIESDSGHSLAGVVGIMPDEDAAEMMRIISEEFGKVDFDEWK